MYFCIMHQQQHSSPEYYLIYRVMKVRVSPFRTSVHLANLTTLKVTTGFHWRLLNYWTPSYWDLTNPNLLGCYDLCYSTFISSTVWDSSYFTLGLDLTVDSFVVSSEGYLDIYPCLLITCSVCVACSCLHSWEILQLLRDSFFSQNEQINSFYFTAHRPLQNAQYKISEWGQN